jgi:ribosomal protein S18 acetylase RimI-like enzyme
MVVEIQNNLQGHNLISMFLANAGSSLKTFRYFSTRPIDCIQNHVLTVLFLEKGVPIAYGHLDKDGDIIWLGICVIEEYKGRAIGKIIIDYLLKYADDNCLNVMLKVDFENHQAISLYKKYNFLIFYEETSIFYLMKRDCKKTV